MKLLYRNQPFYIFGFRYNLGSVVRSLEQLAEEKLIGGTAESLSAMGYRQNAGVKPNENLVDLMKPVVSSALEAVPNPAALIFQHCYGESAVLPTELGDTVGATRNRYFPAALMRELGVDHHPYLCSFASGCAGFISLLISAGGVLLAGNGAPVICLTGDVRPPGTFYDMVRERILGSDQCSSFFAGPEKRGYRVLGLMFYSTARTLVPLVEIVKRTVQMVTDLAESLDLDFNSSEVVLHYPNIFPDAWNMVTRYIRAARTEPVMEGMAERAHCAATDSILSLTEKLQGQDGRLHVVVNYGVGLHLGVCILRETATDER
jgi:hypothetical protein